MIQYSSDSSTALSNFIKDSGADLCFLLTDTHTREFCSPRLENNHFHSIFSIPSGEKFKTLTTAEKIWNWLAEANATRNSILVCLGGGTVTDIGGFAASTYQRGIKTVYLPTTLLCMVDAAIGGKTGINLSSLKNYVGTFHQPEQIIIDVNFLSTLPEAEWQNGKAEILKHACLAGNELFEKCRIELPPATDLKNWAALIKDNADFKNNITTADFKESSIRAMLNFGHTAGHALETLYMLRGETLPHGTAVAAGMLIETRCGISMGKTQPSFYSQLESMLNDFDAVKFAESDIDMLTEIALSDKKRKAAGIPLSLVHRAGQPLEVCYCSEEVFRSSLLAYLNDSQS